ncbi:uncharacterized protein MONOS_5258 [Monocercomonoides exilis]|uniref:uncharacterized protein n=1 Tax=Monocercomonoides exilis TaxID=2049356 RepID=UPI00355AC7A2|nr:hypothetical protein MONOS_5258 [Monocercomonoides exilis]|eukprot:MONOS_5258.1-p1 / transcript=MONOS_5258.1 / gene=MONOS_5258 / organism=Monocercomonoides_exilis_PA203 / gene_product=unspecified product / transcript_product=unspecified product / location=Mono_scaffold00151:47467-47954(+) / protein_length=144 / sequence_SO=supercontig / SO=protein_coding / is_pseudo=false
MEHPSTAVEATTATTITTLIIAMKVGAAATIRKGRSNCRIISIFVPLRLLATRTKQQHQLLVQLQAQPMQSMQSMRQATPLHAVQLQREYEIGGNGEERKASEREMEELIKLGHRVFKEEVKEIEFEGYPNIEVHKKDHIIIR